jgi:cell division septal protein FtsQ
MRTRQSLADIESAFAEQIEEERERAARVQREAEARLQRRRVEQQHRRGTMRFAVLVITLLATAILVTIAMFQALYLVMG